MTATVHPMPATLPRPLPVYACRLPFLKMVPLFFYFGASPPTAYRIQATGAYSGPASGNVGRARPSMQAASVWRPWADFCGESIFYQRGGLPARGQFGVGFSISQFFPSFMVFTVGKTPAFMRQFPTPYSWPACPICAPLCFRCLRAAMRVRRAA